MGKDVFAALAENFLGHAPNWYKKTIVAFLVLNVFMLYTAGPYITGWLLILEFIFTLAMALKCYPLQPGGLLAAEAIILGMTSPATVYHEIQGALEVILLLIFMVAGIYFMKSLLLYVFTKIIVKVRSKLLLSVLFSFVAAVLSAFLDALTVTAVIIAVCEGFFAVYHKVASGKHFGHDHDHSDDNSVEELRREDLEKFRAFLRSLLMHAAVGTALGGVMTMVGEPQNLLIASKSGWNFIEFFLRMAPVTMPVFVFGLLTCAALEKTKWFGYGEELPPAVLHILTEYDEHQTQHRSKREVAMLIVQAVVAIWLVIALALHLAAVGIIGLSVIVFITAFNGVVEEHQIGKAFEEALPFTALLVVFFAIVAVIHDQHLFTPLIQAVLEMKGDHQVGALYLANGALSAISDNVFVATVYINEVKEALVQGKITRDQFDMLSVAINTGTNIPSVATPNGQAAFLFLLTSVIAPLVRLSYGRMVIMAFPYTVTMTLVGLFACYFMLAPGTQALYDSGLIKHHQVSDGDQEAQGKH